MGSNPNFKDIHLLLVATKFEVQHSTSIGHAHLTYSQGSALTGEARDESGLEMQVRFMPTDNVCVGHASL